MNNRTRVAAIAALLSALPACRDKAPPPREPAVRADASTPPQDTAFGGTTAPVRRVRAARPQSAEVLRSAGSASAGPGYDRVVFEFTGDSVPGYVVEYATRPAQRCGSGDPVSVAGAGRLVVRFEPARAHDNQGHPSLTAREYTLDLPAVTEMKLICDFEGQVEWLLGVSATAQYRVTELTGPARLVLDVRHSP